MSAPTNALQRVAAGVGEAVQESIDTHGDLVWGLARRYLQNDDAAEEAVEEVFADLWRYADACPDGPLDELAFVATIARLCLLRQGNPSGTAMPVGGDASCDRVETVELELGRMTLERQEVLSLCVAEGQSAADIATHLALPLPIVRQHIRSGLIGINERLEATDRSSRRAGPVLAPAITGGA